MISNDFFHYFSVLIFIALSNWFVYIAFLMLINSFSRFLSDNIFLLISSSKLCSHVLPHLLPLVNWICITPSITIPNCHSNRRGSIWGGQSCVTPCITMASWYGNRWGNKWSWHVYVLPHLLPYLAWFVGLPPEVATWTEFEILRTREEFRSKGTSINFDSPVFT